MPVGIKLREQISLFSFKESFEISEPTVSGVFQFGDSTTNYAEQAALYWFCSDMDAGTISVKLQESHDATPDLHDSANWVDIDGKEVSGNAVDFNTLVIGLRAGEMSRKYWRWHYSNSTAGSQNDWVSNAIFGSAMSYGPVLPMSENSPIVVD